MDRVEAHNFSKDVDETLLQLIDLPYDDLIAFLEDYANSHPEFCAALHQRLHGSDEPPVLKKSFSEQIDIAFRKYYYPSAELIVTDDSLRMNELSSQLQVFLQHALEAVSCKNYEDAASIGLAILRSAGNYWVNDTLETYYDEEFPLACDCQDAANLLLEVCKQCKQVSLLQQIWAELLLVADLELFRGSSVMDFSEFLAHVAVLILPFDEALSYLNRIIDQKAESGIAVSPLVLLKLEFLKQNKADFLSVCWKYIHFPRVREWYVDWLLKNSRFEDALRILSEGISLIKDDGFRSRAYLLSWLKKKMSIYETQKNSACVIEVAHELFVLSEEKLPYYRILKKWVDGTVWDNFLAGLLKEVTFSTDIRGRNELVEIYLEEKKYPALFQMLSVHTPDRFMILLYYVSFLQKYSTAELLRFLQEELRYVVEEKYGANLFPLLRTAFRTISTLPGGFEVIHALLSEFEWKYRGRASFILELKDLREVYLEK